MTIPRNKISSVKKICVANCIVCNGEGCDDCKSKTARVEKYAASNIPVTYWLLAFKNFSGDNRFFSCIKNIIENIDKFYESGKSCMFTGGLGTGKTFGATSILKKASTSGYDSLYVTMADVVSSIISPSVDSYSYTLELTNKRLLGYR